jgi:Mg2+ and Co2+ transporter CorA
MYPYVEIGSEKLSRHARRVLAELINVTMLLHKRARELARAKRYKAEDLLLEIRRLVAELNALLPELEKLRDELVALE